MSAVCPTMHSAPPTDALPATGADRVAKGPRQGPARSQAHEVVGFWRLSRKPLRASPDGHSRRTTWGQDSNKHVDRMAPVIQHVAVGKPHGIGEQAIAHAAAVHEPALLIR